MTKGRLEKKLTNQNCSTREERRCMMDCLTHLLDMTLYPTKMGCPKSCTTVAYPKTQDYSNKWYLKQENVTHMWLKYDRLSVNIKEMVSLFDFNDIISAVGGSMGMFLGFSFLGLTEQLIGKFVPS